MEREERTPHVGDDIAKQPDPTNLATPGTVEETMGVIGEILMEIDGQEEA